MKANRELTGERERVNCQLQEANKAHQALLEAKEAEAASFNTGISKLITFKNQVRDLLAKNKEELAAANKEKEAVRKLY